MQLWRLSDDLEVGVAGLQALALTYPLKLPHIPTRDPHSRPALLPWPRKDHSASIPRSHTAEERVDGALPRGRKHLLKAIIHFP